MTCRSIKWTSFFVLFFLRYCWSFSISSGTFSKLSTPFMTQLQVYTPEQDEDNKRAVDEVLDSLIEKMDRSELETKKEKANKAMAFLRKMGKVGGASNKDFTNSIGSDEGAGMAAPISGTKKSKSAYKESSTSGIIDDLTEAFPMTSSGTEWRGVGDRVRGGISEGSIRRLDIDEKSANVLMGHVTGENGYIQMVTDLCNDPSKDFVDAAAFDGIEIDVFSEETLDFNLHLKTRDSLQKNSYRYTVNLECLFAWQTIRIPFSSFVNIDSSSIDASKLKRLGIVALDQDTDVYLAISGVRFYNVI